MNHIPIIDLYEASAEKNEEQSSNLEGTIACGRENLDNKNVIFISNFITKVSCKQTKHTLCTMLQKAIFPTQGPVINSTPTLPSPNEKKQTRWGNQTKFLGTTLTSHPRVTPKANTTVPSALAISLRMRQRHVISKYLQLKPAPLTKGHLSIPE
jgi:hypothetical protein